MNWYYVENGQQAGPVDDSQIDALAQASSINPDTLVWHEGMENWRPLREVRPSAAPFAASPLPPIAPLAEAEARCDECGRVFTKESMIRHGGLWICAGCKPVFLQKLSEGAAFAGAGGGAPRYAGFWIRFCAVFVDGILLGIVNFAIGLIGGALFGRSMFSTETPDPGQLAGFLVFQLVLLFIQLSIAVTYETIMVGKYGATVGKMACGLKVVTGENQPLTYGRAFGRYFAKMLSYIICYIGCIMVGFDDEKRGLHDRICNTRVVFK